MKSLPIKLRVFIVVLYIITISSLLFSIHTGYILIGNINIKYILFFAVLAAFTESLTILFFNICFSTTLAVTIASYSIFGPLSTIVIVIIGFSFRIMKLESGGYKHILNSPFYRTVFNYCILILPLVIANYFFISLGGTFGAEHIGDNLWNLIIFGSMYCILNTLIISVLMSLQSNKNLIFHFINNMRMAVLNFLVMTPLGFLLAFIYNQYRFLGVLLVITPILLVRYTISLNVKVESQYIETVNALMHAIEARDKYTEGHSHRVAEISVKIAKRLNYNQWKIEQLNKAAMLHDVGKIGISDTILNKPGNLTDEEFSIIKSHPVIGDSIISEIKTLSSVSEIIRHHHERYDGKGYPEGKKGEELSLDVYIIQLADSVDAMETDRPYRKALSKEQIINEIEQNSGTQFHPKIAEVYLDMVKSKE